jgi:predicted outer membrane protein
MRVIMTAAFLAAMLAAPSAFAQEPTHVHHNFCLKTGSGQDCAYQTMAECEAAKRGGTDFCVENSPPQNH